MLRNKSILSNKICKRENKWHGELGAIYSVDFWNSTRKLYAKINIDNRLLWLQFQIVRNSLQTNYIVSHFMRNVSPLCDYCQESNELVSHLYWLCNIVRIFLQEVTSYFEQFNFSFIPSKTQMLFGFLDKEITDPKNFITLVLKRYIWITKFKTKQLNMNGFKSFLNSYVVDLKYIFELKNDKDDATNSTEWNAISNALSA